MCLLITNDDLGFILGYSPDGLVGDDGQIECKSRKQKYQLETIDSDAVPDEYTIQLQAGLLVSGRKWVDFISYCGGMPMFVKRVYPDIEVQEAIKTSAKAFNAKMQKIVSEYPERFSISVPNNPTITFEENGKQIVRFEQDYTIERVFKDGKTESIKIKRVRHLLISRTICT